MALSKLSRPQPLRAPPLPALHADLSQCTVSGLSSGAFMTVQLHIAHSSMFVGAGVIAGGPYRCAGLFRDAAPINEDAQIQTACFVCMSPLTPAVGPDVQRLVALARETERDRLIDPLDHLKTQKLYLFTGRNDQVVLPSVVRTTRAFYEKLGVPSTQIQFVDDVPAGHAILTTNLDDNPVDANRPPYINRWDRPHMQSQDILEHLLGPLNPPAQRLSGRLLRFDQREFLNGSQRSCMSAYGYAYVPKAVEEDGKCRVHVVLHGCKQGFSYVNLVNGRADLANDAPFGDRYITRTGYNHVADTNRIVVLYPQVEGLDNGEAQNPDGCWDWWGYSSASGEHPDYYSKNAIQIQAIHGMLQRLGGR